MSRRDGSWTRASCWLQLAIPAGLMVGLLAGCGSPVSPEEREAISKLQELGARINIRGGGYEVDLSDTSAGDRDLVHLQKVTNLKSLDLRRTRITDEGLAHLKPIQSLDFVALTGTSVTIEGVANLKKALPNTDVAR